MGRTAICLCVFAAVASEADGDDALAPEVLAKLKQATAYIRVDFGAEQASGSGLLFERNGRRGFVITNSHVVADNGEAANRVRVVLDSGGAGERTLPAKVRADDPARDLAVLEIEGDGLPEPILWGEKLSLQETMPVFILGYPFGGKLATAGENPSVTVSRGNISSIRKNDHGRTVVLQIDGSINPGNSGGPIVSASGGLVGVAVAKLQGTQIGMAIPAEDFRELLLGQIGDLRFRREPGDIGAVKLSVSGRVIDPFQRLAKVSLHLTPLAELTVPPKPNERGEWPPVSINAQEFGLEIAADKLTGVVALPAVEPVESLYIVQPSLIRGNEAPQFAAPVVIDVLALGSGAPADLATVDRAKPPRKPRPPLPDESWVTDAPQAVTDFSALSAEDAFFYQPPGTVSVIGRSGTVEDFPLGEGTPLVARRLRIPAGETAPSVAWSEDCQRMFLATSRGTLRVYQLPQLIEERRLELGGTCCFLGQSRAGLVAQLDRSRHLAVIDPDSLAIKRYIHVREMDSVVCASGSPLAFVLAAKAAAELQIVDLEEGRLVSRVPVEEISEQRSEGLSRFLFWQRPLRLTPDGNFLFAYHAGCVFRLAVVGTNVVFDSATPTAAHDPQGCSLSTDAAFLAVSGYSSGRKLVDHPQLKQGVYVYPVGNLERPSLAVETAGWPFGTVLDVAARRMYTLGTEGLTIHELGGAPPKTYSLIQGANTPTALFGHPRGRGLLAIYNTHAYWIAPKE